MSTPGSAAVLRIPPGRTDGPPAPGSARPAPPEPELRWNAPGSLPSAPIDAAWATGGFGALARVSGPWAVALFDSTRAEHILVADPLGIQPLFWARTPGGEVLAASHLAALADQPDVPDDPDHEGILFIEGLDFDHPDVATRTPFRAISRLPGGHALRISPDGSVRTERYWDASALPSPDEALTLPECAELLAETIDRAVRRLIGTDVPAGAHVSGGLDSTALASLAHRALRESGDGLVAGYSWSPTERLVPRVPGDERELLDEVSAALGFPIRLRDGEGHADWFRNLDPLRYPESSHLHESWVLPQVRADGVRVLLSGWGGDELASYSGWHVWGSLMRQGQLPTVWREVARRRQVISPDRAAPRHTLRRVAGVAWNELPGPVRALRHPRRAGQERRTEQAVLAQLRAFSPLAAEVRAGSIRLYEDTRDPHEHQRMLIGRGHLQHRTTWWYQTGRLFGVDYRYPLLDLDVVAAALRLPWWAYSSRGWDRPAFRMAVEPWVPQRVAWNLRKDEPAVFDPAAMARGRAKWQLRQGPADDPAYDEAMRLARLTWHVAGADVASAAAPLLARPDLAPRSG